VLLELLFFGLGLVALYFGAEWLVGGSSRLASAYGISPVVVGLTIVSFGTSAPELMVSGLASYRGSGDIAVGNVVGSNVANVALILGLSALIRPIAVKRGLVVRDVPVMILMSVLFVAITVNLGIARWEGLLLIGVFAVYMAYVARGARLESAEASAIIGTEDLLESLPGGAHRPGRDVVLTIVGTLALVIGAQLLVQSAVDIARTLGVSEVIIGLTLVAFGTSVPELAASVVASIRGEAQIVLGNIVGSNIFNITLIIGTAALIRPLPIHPSVLYLEGPLMVGISLLLLPFATTNLSVSRWEGGALLATYGIFLVWIIV
jgi:cation:H+ antiporter